MQCPNCEIDLWGGLDKAEADMVALCLTCGEFYCNLCIEEHCANKHELPWVYGYLNEEGIFFPNL